MYKEGVIPSANTEALQLYKFNWHSSSNSLAVMMYDMKKAKASTQSSNVRLVYDKHYEMSRGKRAGIPYECPLCGHFNLNAGHVIENCSHPLVSMARYEAKLEFESVISLASEESFHELQSIRSMITDCPIGFHIRHGIVPGELTDRIRQDNRLQYAHSGKRKSMFNKGMKLLGLASAKPTSVYLSVLYKDNMKPRQLSSDYNSLLRHTRLMKGGIPALRRKKKTPILFMSQFLQPPVEIALVSTEVEPMIVSPVLNKTITIKVTNKMNTLSVYAEVLCNAGLLDIASAYLVDSILDPERAPPLVLENYKITIRIAPRFPVESSSDTGFSGYLVMYAIHNDGTILNLADYTDRKTLSSFIASVSNDATSEITRQEFQMTSKFMRTNPYIVKLTQASGMWLLPSDIMSFDNAPRCIFWGSKSLSGEHISTTLTMDTDDLMGIRSLPHVVVDENDYSMLSLPHDIDPDRILSAISMCSGNILRDIIAGLPLDEYTALITDE